MSERERERERETQSPNHLSVHQWLRFAIHGSQQLTLPIGFLSLKRPPPPDAALLANKMSSGMGYCRYPMILSNYSLPYFDDIAPPKPHQVLPLGFRERWWEVHGRSKRQHRRLHGKLCLLQPQRKVPAEDVPRSKHCFFWGGWSSVPQWESKGIGVSIPIFMAWYGWSHENWPTFRSPELGFGMSLCYCKELNSWVFCFFKLCKSLGST